MKKIVALPLLFALGIFLTGIYGHAARGQTAGTAHIEKGKITQGDSMSMDVTLDKGSNLAGNVYVVAFPDGATNEGVTLSCGLNPTQTSCTATTRMPLEAKLGKWVISKISFAPISGDAKVLSQHGESSFEVVAHGPVVLPDGATVSDIK